MLKANSPVPSAPVQSLLTDPLPMSELEQLISENHATMKRHQELLRELVKSLNSDANSSSTSTARVELDFNLDGDLKEIARSPGMTNDLLILTVLSQVIRRLDELAEKIPAMAAEIKNHVPSEGVEAKE